MNISIYLSESEVEELKAISQEGETVAQVVKRLAKERIANQEDKPPVAIVDHVNRFIAETKWLMSKYKEGKIQE